MGGKILEYKARTIKNEGRTEGRAEGMKTKATEIAINLLACGMPDKQISHVTGLTLSEVEKLKPKD